MRHALTGGRVPLEREPMVVDGAFTAAYFAMVEATSTRAADVIADSIVRDLAPRCLIDVGCGPGVFLERLRERGVAVTGADASAIALASCRARRLDVFALDLESEPLPALARWDTALCLEVASLIEPAAGERCVAMLSTVARAVVFSAGHPGQGGDRVRNERPPEHWIERFAQHGFDCDLDLSWRWRAEWAAAGAAPWFATNVLVFRRARAGTSSAPAPDLAASGGHARSGSTGGS